MGELDTSRVVVPPVRYQSQDITFTDWVTLLTLCLAPLLAHVVRICHYNPTSILWRYAAITDRRIRARSWNTADLAATNALFWISNGWDGSEAMVEHSRAHRVYLPEHSRISIFSREALKTLIVTFQGIQALVLLSGAFIAGRNARFPVWMAVDIIFFPLALIGLLRLCCVLWLNEDFSYSVSNETPPDPQLVGSDPGRSRFRETSYWPSRLFRLLFILTIFGMLTFDMLLLVTGGQYTATIFFVVLFYLLFLLVTAFILVFYFFRGQTTTTVIPCITTILYQVYTAIVVGLGVAVIVVACIETRRTPCGKYTSGQGALADRGTCQGFATYVISVAEEPEGLIFGLAAYNFTIASNGSLVGIERDKQQVLNFTGICFGNVTVW
ncbi:hypothetical protein EDB81DRAFT_844414 [Dactylonectria macrodidyma]|uniref:Uncharacterized protein n=1 Tax=Dactylonectria macrodidyma TaxID=307937 RepID=A0A9P9EBR2_9HYPO|nr:hypothetical protein EDB81DRAFT_844414 [Dactylonectria macrodidyma]